ncbi:phosphatase PAP2 family protein [Variovorax sp. PBL-E5]|uniref:phosphatase PAP2 family protein n=1 Tax=Variovorax sp. PBL-E5 TaxID=434014 RepID=UPI001316E47D|nr:phosphatase PAP2 family protein [Variovorax sp. PBL-E5]VTU16447.1 PAP2 superfamily protein [Variovorax sp. PBL-E5]
MLGALGSLHYFWHLLTRLGEAQILLPAALLTTLGLLRQADARALAIWWIASLAVAILVTAASKVAFIGWGIGWPELNFTGISGHAMLAAAVYPLLLGTLAPSASRAGRPLAVAAGFGLALLIGVSRVVVGAHSVSEVLAGLMVGGIASAMALNWEDLPSTGPVSPLVPAVVALWLMLMPVHAPVSRTHAMVTKFSLLLSGHSLPYTRSGMLRDLRRRQAAPCRTPACTPPIAMQGGV